MREASFNGAITFSLWKYYFERTSNPYDRGFNGAITFSLWKFLPRYDHLFGFESFNGAITFSLWKSAIPATVKKSLISLQWGHNFFVMEIIDRFLNVLEIVGLQWGHNFFVMEIRVPV